MGRINQKIKESPDWMKKAYYKYVPFRYRYGKVYGQTLDLLLKSQHWDEEKLKDYQWCQLRKLLHHCYTQVPYYEEIFKKNNWTPQDFREIEDLKNFPVLTKGLINEHRENLVARNYRDKHQYSISTSGSTGEKLTFFVDDDTFKREAAFGMRSYIQQGADQYDTPTVWLRRYVPPNPESSLWYYDEELKRLYMSAYHLNVHTLESYLKKLNDGQYRTMCTYPSAAYILACLCEEKGGFPYYLKKIHTTSEVLTRKWYDKIKDVFHIIPCGHYGQMEKVSFMHQTEESTDMIQNLEYGVNEFEDIGDGTHSLIATGFINYYMPLLRYKTDDNFIIKDGKVKEVVGRTSDILVSADGSRLPGVNFYSWIDKKMPAIKMFQITQTSSKDIQFNYTQNPRDQEDIRGKIVEGLRARLGEMNYVIRRVDEIKRDVGTNKFKCIINNMV